MEFEKKKGEFEERGLAVIGISYDSVEVLKKFAEDYGVSIPLLSDVGSKVIRQFGIFDEGIKANSKAYGIPHPGIYIIDADLTISDKLFEQSAYSRPTAEAVLVSNFGKAATGNRKSFSNDYLEGYVALTDTQAKRLQVLGIVVEIDLKSDFHVYAKPIPEGYFPFEVTFELDDSFEIDPFVFPEGKPFKVEGLKESFFVYSGKVRLASKLRMKQDATVGVHTVKVTISLQACTDNICKPPEKMEFTLPLEYLEWEEGL